MTNLPKLPSNWREVTLSQYKELIEISELIKEGSIEYWIEVLALFWDISPQDEVFDQLEWHNLIELQRALGWLSHHPKPNGITEWDGLHLKPLNDLFLGEYIDLEHYSSEPIQNMDKIVAILFKKQRHNDWDHTEWEPYTYDLAERANVVNGWPVDIAWNAFNIWIAWRTDFMDKYRELFQADEEPEGEEAPLEGYQKIEAKKKKLVEERQKKWSWEHLLWNMSGEDVTKFNKLFQTKAILVFNILSMKKSLDGTSVD